MKRVIRGSSDGVTCSDWRVRRDSVDTQVLDDEVNDILSDIDLNGRVPKIMKRHYKPNFVRYDIGIGTVGCKDADEYENSVALPAFDVIQERAHAKGWKAFYSPHVGSRGTLSWTDFYVQVRIPYESNLNSATNINSTLWSQLNGTEQESKILMKSIIRSLVTSSKNTNPKNATFKNDKRLSPTSERYKGYLIVLDRGGDGYNVYDKHRELEDAGYPSREAAKQFIDELIDSGEVISSEEIKSKSPYEVKHGITYTRSYSNNSGDQISIFVYDDDPDKQEYGEGGPSGDYFRGRWTQNMQDYYTRRGFKLDNIERKFQPREAAKKFTDELGNPENIISSVNDDNLIINKTYITLSDCFYDTLSNLYDAEWDDVIEVFESNNWISEDELIIPKGTKMTLSEVNNYYNVFEVHTSYGKSYIPLRIEDCDGLFREVTDSEIYSSTHAEFNQYEDDIHEISQEFTSENTSINSGKLPAIFNMVSFKPGTINIDYGGGRFDNVAEYLSQYDVINLVYDPYNRTPEHNKEVIRTVRRSGGADTATCSNVLNVIKEPEVRKNVLENIKKLVKPTGVIYITVYEGTGRGNGGPTKSGYQMNRKTADYLEEIQEVFPDAVRKGKLIIAHPSSSSTVTSNKTIDKTNNGCTIFYDDDGTIVSASKIRGKKQRTIKGNASHITQRTFYIPSSTPDYCPHCCNRSLIHSNNGEAKCQSCGQEYQVEKMSDTGRIKLVYLDNTSISSNDIIANTITNQLPPAVDTFLMDIAQIYGEFSYSDISKHRFSDSEIKQLQNLRRRYFKYAEFDDEDKIQSIIDKVNKIVLGDSLNASTDITAAIKSNVDLLKTKIWNAASAEMEDMGFPVDEIPDYLFVEIEQADDHIRVEVRAEVSYEGIENLITSIDPVIQEYDKDAYFEPAEPGIAEAYIWNVSNITSSETVEAAAYDIPDRPLDPPEDDWKPLDSDDEIIELTLDAIVRVNEDGTWEYDDAEYPWAMSPNNPQGDWYTSDYGIYIGDKTTIVEYVDQLLEPMMPFDKGEYHIQGDVTLIFSVEGIQVKRDYFDDEHEGISYNEDAYIDEAETTFLYDKSHVDNFEVTEH